MSVDLALFPRYAENGASSRLRFFHYIPYLEKAGFAPAVHPFFDRKYLEELYAGKGKSSLDYGKALCRRFRAARQEKAETFFVEYELFPGLPASADLAFLRKKRYFLNFDDWVWSKYARIPFLKDKYDCLIRHASGVIGANAALVEHLSALNPRVLYLPTVIDTVHYDASRSCEKFARFTAVWIGNPATYGYLQQLAPVLKKLAFEFDFELLVIAKASLPPLEGVPCRMEEWNSDREAALLSRCHIGLMPLPESDLFARGKSAYKLIQYMGAGIPALASPVGENCRVLLSGETGFFCSSEEEWSGNFRKLFSDSALRQTMGKAARTRAELYSIQKFAPQLTGFLSR